MLVTGAGMAIGAFIDSRMLRTAFDREPLGRQLSIAPVLGGRRFGLAARLEF